MQETLVQLTFTILLLPLFGFVVLIFFGKRLPRQGDWLGTSLLFIALLLSVIVMVNKLAVQEEAIVYSFPWIDFGNVPMIGPLKVSLGITIDNLSAIMMVVVCIVSALVHLFSIGYMHGDSRYARYFAFLGLFTFSMLVIVVTNNFFTMYVGWELVGLCSYLLIGHWYEKKSAADAAKKAFIVNRIGDIGMFTGIMILYGTFHTFDFNQIFLSMSSGNIPFGSEHWLTAAGILIFCGAIGKSAQFPLHVWLPDAMEGPTPVSALIHAATMVAAGVYLIARTFAMMTADALMVIAYIGAITAFISATIAIVQNDIKKILAYSTISQLGYMVVGLGVGAYTAGFFHLVTHAMFKAGLFLGAGSVIHSMHQAVHQLNDHHTDVQDINNMGGLKNKMPITFSVFLIYTAAIAGIPLFSGFLSKDMILAGTLAFGKTTGHWLIPTTMFFVAGLTAFYMCRLLFLAFFGKPADEHLYEQIRESPNVMTIPLLVFAVMSFWFFFSWNPLDGSEGWLSKAIERPAAVVPVASAALPAHTFYEEMHNMHYPAMGLSLFFAAFGILVAYRIYVQKKISNGVIAERVPRVYKFLLNKWYFDTLYEKAIVGGTVMVTKALHWADLVIIDGLVDGTASWTKAFVFGYREHAKQTRISASVFMLVGVLVSVFVSFSVGQWLMEGDLSLGAIIWSALVALLSGVLTFFFFWAGAGGFDKHIVDGMVNGTAYLSGFWGILLRKLQTGKVQTYIVFVVVGVMVLFYIFRT